MAICPVSRTKTIYPIGRERALGKMRAVEKKVARTLHGNKYLQSTLVEAAWGATRKKDSFLKRKYESLVGRRGKKKARLAVRHKIIVAAYFIILNKEPYKEPQLHDKPKKKKKQTKNYLNMIDRLGISDEQLKELMEQRRQGRIFTEQQQASRV